MQPRNTEAIILRRTNYGEADRILNFLTPNLGKVSAIAKGVRRPKSKLAGGLELFAVSDITVAWGRGELGIITSARMQQFFGDILHDYDRMQVGYAIIKDINKATETIDEPEFYALLKRSLECLNNITIDSRIIELWFRLQLTGLLGHGINLTTDRTGQKLQQDQQYSYDYNEHALYSNPHGRLSGEHIKFLRLTRAKDPEVLRQVKGVEPLLDECIGLVRAIVT